MSTSERGILYIVWGDNLEALLQRSIRSVRKHYPEIPIHVERVTAEGRGSLLHKTRMGSLTPFRTTLYLDADTVVVGNLDSAFAQAERFGLACSLCECPWLRRYGADAGDSLEYNTGVLFFAPQAAEVFRTWEAIAPTTPSASRWTALDNLPRWSDYDDQASFGKAVEQWGFNPFVLPINYNFRPDYFPTFCAPLKIWHDRRNLPPGLEELSLECERGQRQLTVLDVVSKH